MDLGSYLIDNLGDSNVVFTQELPYNWVILLTGTSTGGILAAALGINGYDGKRCVEVYEELIPIVFKKNKFHTLLTKVKIKRTAYKYENLKQELEKHFPTPTREDDKKSKKV